MKANFKMIYLMETVIIYGKQLDKNIKENIKMEQCMEKAYMNGVKGNFIEVIS